MFCFLQAFVIGNPLSYKELEYLGVWAIRTEGPFHAASGDSPTCQAELFPARPRRTR